MEIDEERVTLFGDLREGKFGDILKISGAGKYFGYGSQQKDKKNLSV
jgi:hypothetical protein